MEIENKLEIVLITYNRARLLEKTLLCFLDSPFLNCRITILNNCSTDNTIEIVNSFSSQFSNLNLVTNKFNIGGDANFMRAIEMVTSDYIWIICDDDEYDFSNCEDVIDCILNEKAELINLGAHKEDVWKYGGELRGAKDLYNMGYPYFKASSFIPNNLFKRSTIFPFIIDGYKNIVNLYPHMPYLLSYYRLNKPIYVSKKRIVTAVIGAQQYQANLWGEGWLNISKLLESKSEIKNCFFDQWNARNFYGQVKVGLIFYVNLLKGMFFRKTVLKVFLILPILQKITLLLLIFPCFCYFFLRSFVLKFRDKRWLYFRR